MTSYQQTTQPILILGGSGKTGGRIATQLASRGIPVRIGSRASNPSFDWEDRSTWAAALDGVSAAYICYYPDLAAPGAAEAIGTFARLAVGKGVKRLVLLSGRGEPEAQQAEAMVQQSGAEWTILRCSWFMQNFSESFLLDPVLSGEVALPVGAVGEPFVDADDIAEAAVAAFTSEEHVGQLYELTGPRLLSFAQAVAEIGEASGRSVRFIETSLDEFKAGLVAQNVPQDLVQLLTMLFTEVLDGRNQYLSDGVSRALGRPARDFADYARKAAATGAWGAEQ